MKRAKSTKETIICELLYNGAKNVSELSRSTGVSRAVLTREADLLTEEKYLVANGNRLSVNPKIILALLSVHKGIARLCAISSNGTFDSERIPYIESLSLEDSIMLAGRRLLEYSEYLRAEGYTVFTAVLFDGKDICDIPTLKSTDIQSRQASVLAYVLGKRYPDRSVLYLDLLHLTSVMCYGGEVICEGGEISLKALLRSASASISLFTPSVLVLVGGCEEDGEAEYGTDGSEAALYERLCTVCKKQNTEVLHIDDIEAIEAIEAYEMLARIVVRYVTPR